MSIEVMLEQNVIKPFKKIKKISEPLLNHFGIDDFWFSKTAKNGNHIILGGHADLHNYYYFSNLFVHSPFFRNPNLISTGFYIYKNIECENFQNSMNMIEKKVNLHLCGTIITKKNNEIIRFGYAAKIAHASNTINLMLNHYDLITKFNEYFLEEAKDIICKADDYAINLALYNPQFDLKDRFKSALDYDEKLNFLKSIKQVENIKIFDLSIKEKNCLKYILKGHSAPQIANLMKLSSRTIEHYMENIKNKLNCHTKQELFRFAPLLNQLEE